MNLSNLELAAQCWGDEKTRHLEIVPCLTEAIVKKLDQKDKDAAKFKKEVAELKEEIETLTYHNEMLVRINKKISEKAKAPKLRIVKK
jgi:cell division protein FtsB